MKQVIENLGISSEQLEKNLTKKTMPLIVFDIRTKENFEKTHIAGSVHAVCNEKTKKKIIPNIPKNIKIVIVSESEEQSKKIAEMMSNFGLDTHYLSGGFSSWKGVLSKGKTGKTILSEEVLDNLDKEFLLDVRDSDEFSEYHIPGSVNVPLEKLFNKENFEKIPKDKSIVTICQKGNKATVASYILEKTGIDSKILDSGLTQWNQLLNKVSVTENPKIIQIQKVGKGCLSHIVESNGEAIVIDPLYPVQKYIDIATNDGFKITKVFDTHQHADHVSAARELSDRTNSKLYLSKYEEYDYNANLVADGDTLGFGDSKLRVIHTPGHTPGSLGFVVDEKYVFTGDILFVDSIGRPDLRDKAQEFTEQLYETLHKKLLSLPDKILVFPTHHGENANPINDAFYSTIKESRKLPWLDIPKEEFIKKVIAKTTPRPMNYRKIISVNKGELELIQSDIPELEIGPNRCAVASR